MLDSLVLVGFPEEEYKRRKAWLSLPRTARAAIRRMHRMLSHKPKSVMLHILKGARADPVLIEAVKHFRCPDCPEEHTRAQPVKAPSLYLFNFEVVVDVLEIKDDGAERYSCLSCVCNGTTFHLVWMVSVGGGQPKSTKCLRKFLQGWVAWAGWPKVLTCDRGLHNRGAFSRALTDNGVYVRMAALEAPEQIGRGEVHGKIYKKTLRAAVKTCHIVGKQKMKYAISVNCAVKNEHSRKGGIAPSCWVLGKHPRDPGRLLEEEERGQLGVLHALHGPEHAGTEFALKAQYRLECQKSFVRLDCGGRYAKTQLRQAAPIPKDYQCGDMVMYKREQGAEEPGVSGTVLLGS